MDDDIIKLQKEIINIQQDKINFYHDRCKDLYEFANNLKSENTILYICYECYLVKEYTKKKFTNINNGILLCEDCYEEYIKKSKDD